MSSTPGFEKQSAMVLNSQHTAAETIVPSETEAEKYIGDSTVAIGKKCGVVACTIASDVEHSRKLTLPYDGVERGRKGYLQRMWYIFVRLGSGMRLRR